MLVLLLTACAMLPGNGIPAEESRIVAPFDAVRVTSSVDVVLEVAGSGQLLEDDTSDQELVVRCDRNLLGEVRTEVKAGTLTVRTPNHVAIQPRTRCVVEGFPDRLTWVESTGSGDVTVLDAGTLQEALSSGSGDLDIAGVDSSDLQIRSTGSGDVAVEGAVDDLSVTNTGSGDLDGKPLRARTADVRNTGSGDVALTVTRRLSVTNTGSGDVSVWGDPQVERRTNTGSGDIRLR